MRRIAVVTVGRSDWGIYRPLLRQLRETPGVELLLVAGGMHLAPEFGATIDQIEAEGFAVAERVEMLLSSDSPLGSAKSMGLGVMGFAEAFHRLSPDLVVVLGDRFEMHSAALATLPLRLPLAHIHGGELTLGAIDDSLRHAISKMAHLHFPAAEAYANRLRRMGEESWRITVAGALALDNLRLVPLPARDELAAELGVPLDPAPLLATFHPETLAAEPPLAQLEDFLEALEASGHPLVFTLPNADPGGRALAERIHAFVAAAPRRWIRDNLGSRRYFGLMAHAAAMVGNSSSGLIEAPSFGLPVVNVGGRQGGRLRPVNVIDCACRRAEITAAIARAVSPQFRQSLAGVPSPFDLGRPAAGIIAERLVGVPLGPELLTKRFDDGERP